MGAKQKQEFLINVAYWAFVLLVVYLVFKYVFPITVPFLLGYCVAFLVVKLSKRIKWNPKLQRIIFIVLFYATIGVVIAFLCCRGLES